MRKFEKNLENEVTVSEKVQATEETSQEPKRKKMGYGAFFSFECFLLGALVALFFSAICNRTPLGTKLDKLLDTKRYNRSAYTLQEELDRVNHEYDLLQLEYGAMRRLLESAFWRMAGAGSAFSGNAPIGGGMNREDEEVGYVEKYNQLMREKVKDDPKLCSAIDCLDSRLDTFAALDWEQAEFLTKVMLSGFDAETPLSVKYELWDYKEKSGWLTCSPYHELSLEDDATVGDHVIKLMKALKSELPGFTPLSVCLCGTKQHPILYFIFAPNETLE